MAPQWKVKAPPAQTHTYEVKFLLKMREHQTKEDSVDTGMPSLQTRPVEDEKPMDANAAEFVSDPDRAAELELQALNVAKAWWQQRMMMVALCQPHVQAPKDRRKTKGKKQNAVAPPDPMWQVVMLEKQALDQIDYYFSASNLCHDIYLRSLMDSEGWVDLEKIVAFPRLQWYGLDARVAASILLTSKTLEVSYEKALRVRIKDEKVRNSFGHLDYQKAKDTPQKPSPAEGVTAD